VNHHLSIGQSLVRCQDFKEEPRGFPPWFFRFSKQESYPQKQGVRLLITHFQHRDWCCGNIGTGVAVVKKAAFPLKNIGTGVAVSIKILRI